MTWRTLLGALAVGLALSATVASTAWAKKSPGPVQFVTLVGNHSLLPGDPFRVFGNETANITLETTHGNFECGYAPEGYALIGQVVKNDVEPYAVIEATSVYGTLDGIVKNDCNSTIALGDTAILESEHMPWLLVVEPSGKVRILGASGADPELSLMFSGGERCYYEAAVLKGTFPVSHSPQAFEPSFDRRKVKLDRPISGTHCPKSAKLTIVFEFAQEGTVSQLSVAN